MKIICRNAAGDELVLQSGKHPYYIEKAEGLSEIYYTIPTTKAAGQDGETLGAATANTRNIILTLQICTDYQKYRDILYNFFQSGEVGTFFYYNGDIERKTEYAVESIVHPPNGTVRRAVISLLCGDPHFYDIEETRVQLASWLPLIEFPLEIIGAFAVTEKETTLMANIYNGANTQLGIRARFEAVGEVVNPKIIDVNRQKVLQVGSSTLPITMHAGDTLEISTGKNSKLAILTLANGTKTNIISAIAYPPQWVQLLRGDNLIRYDADSGIDALSCDVYYRNSYAGC